MRARVKNSDAAQPRVTNVKTPNIGVGGSGTVLWVPLEDAHTVAKCAVVDPGAAIPASQAHIKVKLLHGWRINWEGNESEQGQGGPDRKQTAGGKRCARTRTHGGGGRKAICGAGHLGVRGNPARSDSGSSPDKATNKLSLRTC